MRELAAASVVEVDPQAMKADRPVVHFGRKNCCLPHVERCNYAVAILPLIHRTNKNVKQAWYADNAIAVGKVCDLRARWDDLVSSGPLFGYFVNASKSSLVLKESHLATATKYFENTNINITTKEAHI